MRLSLNRIGLWLVLACVPALSSLSWVLRDTRAESNRAAPAVSASADATREETAGTAELQAVTASAEPSRAHLGFVGAGSCAASNCHGGDGSQRDPFAAADLSPRLREVNRAYRVWLERDPHARAYEVLQNELSQRMIKSLNARPGLPKLQPAHREALCLNCHSTKPASGSAAALPEHILADGVSCESCHGGAEHWLARHYRPSQWPRDAAAREDLGFRNTEDLHARARLCAECHVGSAGRDVNHDLIAAGHPRLNFEFAAYLANLPAHWDQRTDRLREEHVIDSGSLRTSFETRAFVLGQLASAEAAVDLLAQRAESTDAIWPEYSEYDCFACHHNLRANSWRQEHASNGQPQWGTWYFALAPQLVSALNLPDSKPFDEKLEALAAIMNQPVPPREQAASAARDAQTILQQWTATLRQTRPDAAQTAALLKAITKEAPPGAANWDQAAQTYLAAGALQLGYREADEGLNRRPSSAETQYQARLTGLKNKLEFADKPVRYNSPTNFDPRSLAELIESLGQIEDNP